MLITIDSKDLQKLTGKLSELGKVQLPQQRPPRPST
jgi:hypothetical protein